MVSELSQSVHYAHGGKNNKIISRRLAFECWSEDNMFLMQANTLAGAVFRMPVPCWHFQRYS